MIIALLCGAGVGAGLWLFGRGLAPPRPTLAATLAGLRYVPQPRPAPVEPAEPGGLAGRVGRPLARALLPAGGATTLLAGVRRDLRVLDRSVEQHAAEKVTLALLGLLLVPACAALLAVAGAGLPLAVPVWGSLAAAAGLFVVPDLGVHADAQARRRDFRHALSSFLDLVVISLAAGGGVETALADAARVGDGWAFEQLRGALDTARLARQTPWSALELLGEELGVGELAELAASVGLAGGEGAKVRASLAAKAASLRAHLLADAEGEAQASTERMSLPVVLLFAGFLFFVGFPAVARVLGGL